MDELLQYETFDKYLRNELSDSERKDFEQQLRTDKKLQQEFRLHKEISNQVILAEKENFINNLTEFDTNHPLSLKSSSLQKVYLYAAAIAVLLVGMTYLLGKNSNNKLYKNYYSYYPLEQITTSRDGSIPEAYSDLNEDEYLALNNAYFAYGNKDFQESLNNFELISESSLAAHPNIIFYKSLCFMELNQAKQAIEGLLLIANSPTNSDSKVSWYLALSHLKNKDKSKAMSVLKDIKTDSPYYVQAQQLLSVFIEH